MKYKQVSVVFAALTTATLDQLDGLNIKNCENFSSALGCFLYL
jgi:hypothetical protein